MVLNSNDFLIVENENQKKKYWYDFSFKNAHLVTNYFFSILNSFSFYLLIFLFLFFNINPMKMKKRTKFAQIKKNDIPINFQKKYNILLIFSCGHINGYK